MADRKPSRRSRKVVIDEDHNTFCDQDISFYEMEAKKKAEDDRRWELNRTIERIDIIAPRR